MRLGRYLTLVNSVVITLIVVLTLYCIKFTAYRVVENRFREQLLQETVSISQQITELLRAPLPSASIAFRHTLLLAEPHNHVRILFPDDDGRLRVLVTSGRLDSMVPCNLLDTPYRALLQERADLVHETNLDTVISNAKLHVFNTRFCYSQQAHTASSAAGEDERTYSCEMCQLQDVWVALLPIYAPDTSRNLQSLSPAVLGYVEVIQSKAILADVDRLLQNIFLIASLICLLVVVGATYAISRFFASPLSHITESIKNIQDTAEVTTPVQVANTHGIREVQELTQAFQGLQRRLGRSLHSKQQLASNLSHELRNALGALELDIATLSKRSQHNGADPMDEEIRQDMRQNVSELIEMSDRSLNALFTESGYVQLHQEVIALAPLLQETLSVVQGLAEQKQVRLVTESFATVPFLRVDRAYFKNDVLLEIMINAIDYSSPDGEVAIGANRTEEWCRLWIRDTGPGIDPDHHEAIFEPYYRVQPTFNPGLNNRGLGLSLARNMVRQHGGDIHVESEPGKGSTFSIVLPYVQGDTSQAPVL